MRNILLCLILLSVFSCQRNIEENKMGEINNKTIDLLKIINEIEKKKILFDEEINHVSMIERLFGFEVSFTNKFNGNIFTFYYNLKKSTLDLAYLQDSLTYINKYQDIIRYGDSIFNIFKELNLINFTISPWHNIRNDSIVYEFITCYYDSSYKDLIVADSNYYDWNYKLDNELNKKEDCDSKYYFTLVFIPNDSIESNYFKSIKEKRKIKKVKNNWYFYRRQMSIELNFRNFIEKSKNRGR